MKTEKTEVAILTARGMSAIASISLAGLDAHGILKKVFHAGKPMAKGSVVHGWIVDGDRMIDEVVVGCEGTHECVIHCHGNPLLLEQIVHLLQSHGATLADANTFLLNTFRQDSSHLIEAEAKLSMQKSATLAGAKILQSQINGGLSAWVRGILKNTAAVSVDTIHQQCRDILHRGRIAERIINGVRVVIAGPPNSGKSTLLNCLAGQEQVITSEMAGTTRDWVSITCFIGPLRVEFIDTAGLDDTFASRDEIERAAQGITNELIDSCDLILYVQDISADHPPLTVSDYRAAVVSVYNKCDLVQEPIKSSATKSNSPISGRAAISISARNNHGIDLLSRKIVDVLEVHDFDVNRPVAFTQRQQHLLSAMLNTATVSEELLSNLIFSENGT